MQYEAGAKIRFSFRGIKHLGVLLSPVVVLILMDKVNSSSYKTMSWCNLDGFLKIFYKFTQKSLLRFS